MCSKLVEAWNKLIIKFSASSWLILRNKHKLAYVILYAIPFSTLTRHKNSSYTSTEHGRRITSSCINTWVVYGATWQLSVKLKRKRKRRRPNFIKSSHDDTASTHYCFETRFIPKEAVLPIHKPSLNRTIINATRDETSPFTLVMELVEFLNTSVNFYHTTWRHIPESGFPISRPNFEHDITQIRSSCVSHTTELQEPHKNRDAYFWTVRLWKLNITK